MFFRLEISVDPVGWKRVGHLEVGLFQTSVIEGSTVTRFDIATPDIIFQTQVPREATACTAKQQVYQKTSTRSF